MRRALRGPRWTASKLLHRREVLEDLRGVICRFHLRVDLGDHSLRLITERYAIGPEEGASHQFLLAVDAILLHHLLVLVEKGGEMGGRIS